MGLFHKSLFWLAVVLAISHANCAMEAIGGVMTADSGTIIADTSRYGLHGDDISALWSCACRSENRILRYQINQLHPTDEVHLFSDFSPATEGYSLMRADTLTSNEIGVPYDSYFSMVVVNWKQNGDQNNQGKFSMSWDCVDAGSVPVMNCSANYISQSAGRIEIDKFNQQNCHVVVVHTAMIQNKYPLRFEATMARECDWSIDEECPKVSLCETKNQYMKSISQMGDQKWAQYNTSSPNNMVIVAKQSSTYSSSPNNFLFEWNEADGDTDSTSPPGSTTTALPTTTTTPASTTTTPESTTTTTPEPTTTTTPEPTTTTTPEPTTTTPSTPPPQPAINDECGGRIYLYNQNKVNITYASIPAVYYGNNECCAWHLSSDENGIEVCFGVQQAETDYDGYSFVWTDPVTNELMHYRTDPVNDYKNCKTFNAAQLTMIFSSDGSVRKHGCNIQVSPTGGMSSMNDGKEIEWVSPTENIGSITLPTYWDATSNPNGKDTVFLVKRDLSTSMRGNVTCNSGASCKCAQLPRYVSTDAFTMWNSWPDAPVDATMSYDIREMMYCQMTTTDTNNYNECTIQWENY